MRKQPSKPFSGQPKNRFKAFNWSHGLFFLLGILAVVGLKIVWPFPGSEGAPRTIPPLWGELDYTTLKLERPEESLPKTIPAPEPIQWHFGHYSKEQLTGFLQGLEFTPEQLQSLLEQGRWERTTNGWQISPAVEVVRDMGLSARKAVYAVLAQDRRNTSIRYPLRLPAEKLEEWLTDCALPKERQELLRRLMIPEGDMVCLYDSALMEWLCSAAEKRSLAKALGQTFALMMKLHITPQSDLERLLGYWGQGKRGKAMRPFLESLARVPEGTKVSVSFFLPTFARMRLYTYPDSQKEPSAERQDCFWTAMNFFNETPDPGFFDANQIQAKLKTDYAEVSTNNAFGDLILLSDTNKMAVHMCVYVADNVVFTKNGPTVAAPWVLMRMTEMLKQYSGEGPLRMRVYRQRAL